jgi:hypothetical protein
MLFSVVSCTPNDVSPDVPTSPESGAPSNDEPSAPESDAPNYPANGAEKIITKTIKLYETSEKINNIDVAHYDGCPEILIMDTDTLREVFLDDTLSERTSFEYEETETTLTIKRSNGSYCTLDFVEDTVYFDDFDLFTAYGFGNMADLLGFSYVDDEGNSFYFKRTESSAIAGLPVYIDLANRNIPLDIYEGKKYIPFQTFNDIFLSPFGYNFVYNSKDLFMSTNGSLDPSVIDEYYSIEPTDRSEALIEYTTAELCLLLDLFYGLQDEHGLLVGFETFFEHTGLWEDLTSPDASKSDSAIAALTFGYLADKHSYFNMASPYTGSSGLKNPIKLESSYAHFFDYMGEIKAARNEIMSEGVSAYKEIGNTAYITFDTFDFSMDRGTPYNENTKDINDTAGLIIYAHSMITREDSPVENVVLDLSCNTGGVVDVACYVVAWMLGYCDVHIINPITNSYATSSFVVDVNLDGVFDEKDSIANKNLYCLISPVSFSCGNLVPSLLKESGKVTMLGGTSGGGACSVQLVSTADGSLFQISSPRHSAVVSNGAYYTIDRGVEPHHYFSKFESYFDREALTEYINGLK